MTPGESRYPRIPYGVANFRRIRLERRLYVDKTRFLRALEEHDHAVLIRPRRFGKTCWVSLLEHYYDRAWAHEFDAVFGGTDIGRQPTVHRHRYVVLRFNFSTFRTALDGLEHHFEEYCQLRLRSALERNPDLFPDAAVRRIRAPESINGQLNELFAFAGERGIPLYALIDEYDNFANTVLVHHGEAAYRTFTHGGGFYRNFFATLKAGTEAGGGGLERLFITGVSPVTLDDVTSGFNIGSNISLQPQFNDLLGFTEDEVRGLLQLYRDRGVLDEDVDAALDVMREWYTGYRFARRAEGDLYHTTMVLYYLCESVPNRAAPRGLVDTNARIDYGRLRPLLLARGAPSRSPVEDSAVVGRRLNGNFDLLQHVIGEGRVDAHVQPSFPLERLGEAGELPLPAVLLRPAQLPGRAPRHPVAGHSQPDRPTAAVRLTCATPGATSTSSSVDAYEFSRVWCGPWPARAPGGRRWSTCATPSGARPASATTSTARRWCTRSSRPTSACSTSS